MKPFNSVKVLTMIDLFSSCQTDKCPAEYIKVSKTRIVLRVRQIEIIRNLVRECNLSTH